MNVSPDDKVHGTNTGPTWILSAQLGPILGPWILVSVRPIVYLLLWLFLYDLVKVQQTRCVSLYYNVHVAIMETVCLTHQGRQHDQHSAGNILKLIFWNEMCCIWIPNSLKFFLRAQLMICQQKYRQWLGALQAPSHFLKQLWTSLLTHICIT